MAYTIKTVIDSHPEWLNDLKQKCYAINGCLTTVHSDLGAFLNEYIYQDALQILLDEKQIPHKHYLDFLIDESIIVECKAVEKLCIEHRQQLWNYMRLTGKKVGILYNFGPIKGQSEHYFLDADGTMYMF